MMPAMLIVATLTALLGFPVLLLLRRLRVRQKISEYVPEHLQKEGTPTAGGITMLLAMLLFVALLLLPVLAPITTTAPDWLLLWVLLLCGFAAIGFLDDFVIPRLSDKRGLGWIPKLVLQLAVALPICHFFLTITEPRWLLDTFSHPLATIAAAIVVAGIANAVNLTDGMDGLAAGVVALAALGLYMGGADALTCALLAGCSIGFLVYNAPPAKVFMGDTGSLMLGAGLGLTLLADPHPSPWMLILLAVLLMELLPVPVQILWVKLFGRRLFVRTPIHHAFQQKGIPELKVVAAFLVVQAVCTVVYGWVSS